MTTKVCSKCKVEKDLGEFYKKKERKDGLDSMCKECRAFYMSKWRAQNTENQEKAQEREAKWRAENPDKCRVYSAKWRSKNSEKQNARVAKWRAENPDKCRAYCVQWASENPEKVKARTARRVLNLEDSYVRGRLNLPNLPNPPQELIELKREQLQMHRVTQCLLKTFKDEDNE